MVCLFGDFVLELGVKFWDADDADDADWRGF